MIEVEAFSKTYDGTAAVRDLSFEARAGEILGLVGPNGAGKTTTLRAIAGILRPTSGKIRVAGHDVQGSAIAAKRALAFVPDTPHPFDLLTVAEHLRFTALAYGIEDWEARAQPLLEELELAEKRDALGPTLSRGMQQKLAIACAFLREPRAILFDEPLTGLDPKGIRSVRESIRRRAAAGATLVVSSHLLELVEKVCDRVLVLHQGRRLALGTLGEIRAAAAARSEASLEEVFLAITEGEAPPG